MDIKNLYLLISNEGIDVSYQAPEIIPTSNFIFINVIPDNKNKNIETIYSYYKYNKDEKIISEIKNINICDNLTEKIHNYTKNWTENEISTLVGTLNFKGSLIDNYVASVAIYLTFNQLVRSEEFNNHTPLAYSFSVMDEPNPFNSHLMHYYILPCRVCSTIGQNDMGNNFVIGVLNHINIWGEFYNNIQHRNYEQTIVNETITAFGNYILSQIERTGSVIENMNLLKHQVDNTENAILEKLNHNIHSITTNIIKTSFKKYLSEVYRNYEEVLTDSLDDLINKRFSDYKTNIEQNLNESKSLNEKTKQLNVDTKRLYDDISIAVDELKGVPTDINMLSQRMSMIESRLSSKF
jgi:hypothetical protein